LADPIAPHFGTDGVIFDAHKWQRECCAGGRFEEVAPRDSSSFASFAGHRLAFLLGCLVAIAVPILVRFAIGVNRERGSWGHFVEIADVFPSR
jgi:hypothetical protein